MAAIWAWVGRAARDPRETRKIAVFSFFLLLCGFYVCWEQFFYNGALPAGQRYDFPALLIDPVLAGAAFYVLQSLRERVSWVNRQFSPLAFQICFILLMLPIVVIYYDHGRLLSLASAVRISNDHTAAMARDLGSSRTLAAQHPDWPIIVVPTDPMDYESVVTFPLWLKYERIANPASVYVDIAPREITSPFLKTLVGSMREVSDKGHVGLYAARNAAVANAQQQGHCYVVEFRFGDTSCTRLPYHPAEYLPVD